MKLEDNWRDAARRPDAQRANLAPMSRATRALLVRLIAGGEISKNLRTAIEREIAESDALIGSIPASEWMKRGNLG